jgi:hypothetical protein
VIRDRRRPGKFVRRHFEVCVFSHLADELRTGDVAVIGSASYRGLRNSGAGLNAKAK